MASTLCCRADALRTISSSATIRRRLPLVGAFCVFTLGISNLLPTLSFSAFRTGTAQSFPFAPLLRSKFGSQSAGVGSVRMEGSSDTTVPSIVVYVTVPSREVG
ncbi:hypothetical protein C1H46_045225 [Malus baccata]|uniref:Uncharacterized protein n=1 Tax=Malus baccata TaxID=106549 RepID=A0A540K5S7_MALBA|nr:hypothetical protein C1H46_045225 [Malus baccata]